MSTYAHYQGLRVIYNIHLWTGLLELTQQRHGRHALAYAIAH